MDTIEQLASAYKNALERYGFFDVNCWFPFKEKKSYHLVDYNSIIAVDLLNDTTKRVVTSAESVCYDPGNGNDALFGFIREKENLHGAAVISPEMEYKGAGIEKYLDNALKNRTVAVRMFPETLRHSMKRWQIGIILDYLQYHRLPLMLWHTQTNWETVNDICGTWKNLPVIIEGNDQKLLYHNRSYIKLMLKHENLHLETHALIQFREIEHLVNDFEISRLLYGSYFPYNDPNASMMTIANAEINEHVKHLIAHGNLERLIDNIVTKRERE